MSSHITSKMVVIDRFRHVRIMLANPPPWPDGKRCAVAFSFDVDADSVVHATATTLKDSFFALQYMRYDPMVAIPRLTQLFGDLEVPTTFFVPAWVAESYPNSLECIVKYDNEVAHHGYYHEWPTKQTPAEQQDTILSAHETLSSLTGGVTVGYRAPYYGITEETIAILAEAGFLYDSSLFADDVPILLRTNKGDLIELPIPDSVDDYNQYVSARAFNYLMTVSPPDRAVKVFRSEFDALWEFGGLWVGVWHPAISGRPARVLEIRKLIEYMQTKGDVWFATHAQIANHIRGLIERKEWSPRVDVLPLYPELARN